MEMDKNLVNLQGTLYSLWMQGLLNKPDKFQQVIKGIKEVSDSVPDDAKSKLTFLMILHTKLSVSEELKYDKFVGHCLNTDPYIEKEYLITYLYHLNLQKELFTVIENFPGALGLELLIEIIEKLKAPNFHKDEFGFEHIYKLWESIFVKLCKLDKQLHKEKYTENFTHCFQDVYNLIEQILITSMNTFDYNEFVGLNLYHFFKALLFFIMLHRTPKVSDDPLYKLSIKFDINDNNVCCNSMKNSIDKVFGKISNILKNLTIDMWMFFSECYYPGSTNSLQLLIGDLVFKILKEVKPFFVPPDVLNFLSSISINKLELIAKDDIKNIIRNVRNGEKEWFQGLLKPSAFLDVESVKCLIDHLELANSDDLGVILKTSYEHLCSNDQNDSLVLMKKLFLAALKKTPDYSQWLEKIFETYRPTFLSTDETHSELLETFNKISKGSNTPDCDLILLCVQSPLETLKKICHIAVYGAKETKFITEVLKLLTHPCRVSYIDSFTLLDYILLKSLLEELTIKEKQSFINLIICLGQENLLGPSFYNNLLKCVKEYLENEVLEKAVLCLEILNAILGLKIFEVHNIVLLVFMAQILGHFSWDLCSFSNIKSDGRDLTDSIVTLIISNVVEEENFKGSDLQWARQEIIKLEEINQAYFCDLWYKFNYYWIGSGSFHSLILALSHSHYKVDDLRNFLIKFDTAFEVRASIILSLMLILPVLTFQKWNSVFRQLTIVWRDINSEKTDTDFSHCVLDMFGSALQMLSMNLKHVEDTFPCFKYCLRNFGQLTKECCSKMNEESLLLSFEKIFVILGVIKDDEKRKSCWEICSPVLMELVEKLKRKNVLKGDTEKIKGLLPLLDLKDIGEALLKKLQ